MNQGNLSAGFSLFLTENEKKKILISLVHIKKKYCEVNITARRKTFLEPTIYELIFRS